MKKALTGLSALALVATLAVGCTDTGTDRVGERRDRDRTPAASPPTTTSPSTSPATPPSTSRDTTTTTTPGSQSPSATTPGSSTEKK